MEAALRYWYLEPPVGVAMKEEPGAADSTGPTIRQESRRGEDQVAGEPERGSQGEWEMKWGVYFIKPNQQSVCPPCQ